ncbi:MAG: hypothetical protein ACK56F_12880, partial [bacterium]
LLPTPLGGSKGRQVDVNRLQQVAHRGEAGRVPQQGVGGQSHGSPLLPAEPVVDKLELVGIKGFYDLSEARRLVDSRH